MCKTRAYKRACGHVSICYLSNCRFTYATSANNPMCHGSSSPSFTVILPERCQDCEHQVFCDFWNAKIDVARERYEAARDLLHEMIDDGGCSELDGANDDDNCSSSWIDNHLAITNSSLDETTIIPSFGNLTVSDAATDKDAIVDTTNSPGSCCDTDLSHISQHCRTAWKDLQDVKREYEQESWDNWRAWAFVDRSAKHGLRLRAERNKRRVGRNPGAKVSGGSPLRTSMSTADLPEPMPEEAIIDDDDEELDAECASDDSSESLRTPTSPSEPWELSSLAGSSNKSSSSSWRGFSPRSERLREQDLGADVKDRRKDVKVAIVGLQDGFGGADDGIDFPDYGC